MGLFDILKRIGKNHSSKWTDDEKREIIKAIEAQNKEKAVVHKEVFQGEGKPYRYYYESGQLRSEGFYYCLGFDKRGEIQDEKFQGKQIEYYENGKIKELDFYKDGIPTGEYYSYDENGNLAFKQLPSLITIEKLPITSRLKEIKKRRALIGKQTVEHLIHPVGLSPYGVNSAGRRSVS